MNLGDWIMALRKLYQDQVNPAKDLDLVIVDDGEIRDPEPPRIAYRSRRRPEFVWREVDPESDRGEKVVRI